jgi:hypothetical protein
MENCEAAAELPESWFAGQHYQHVCADREGNTLELILMGRLRLSTCSV